MFEVDCGHGEFLVPLYSNGYRVGGSDANAASIERARADMPDGLFSISAAAALDPAIPWDVVICRSIAGAPDLDYTRGLVARMFAKATHAIALLSVPEADHRPILHALAEVGATAIQIDGEHVFARV